MNNTFTPQLPGLETALLDVLRDAHTPEQQLWLSGYLYGLASARRDGPATTVLAAESPAGNNALKIKILYGSQTGNSKKVANQTLALLRDNGLDASVADLNDYPAKNLRDEKIVLLIASTQGEGDPPVSAEEFHGWLHGPRAPRLEGIQFAVCALGDKSYLKYCQTGKEFDQRFEALGATRLVERADCDTDYEETAAAWQQQVLTKLRALKPEPATASHVKTNGQVKTAVAAQFDRKRPFQAPVLEKIQLNGRGSARETWHLELSLEDSGLTYEAGDALGIYPTNAPGLVREVLHAASLNGNKVVQHRDREGTLNDHLQGGYELSVLNRELLEKYAAVAQSPRLDKLLADTEALKNYFWGRNVADLLRDFPAAISEATLLSLLRHMPPRLYSIASGPSARPGEVHLTVAALRYQYNGSSRQGVASTFLADRVAIGDNVPVFLDHNEYFKLPASDATDIIMVGPGTGVAPFRAFVEERAERGASGKNWLFFGNPHFSTDFLYQSEWLNHLKNGTLDRLDVAFSRDQEHKVYVQQRLLERARLIFERLENGANFYVCGDKNRMAADVQAAVVQLIAKESGKGDEFATDYLKNLKKQRRYLEDVY